MLYRGDTFKYAQVHLDGNQFERCTFIECKMIYMAEGTVSFDGCIFTECVWVVDEAAERMLFFLSALYRGLGPQGEELVETIFDQVRNGTIGQVVNIPAGTVGS